MKTPIAGVDEHGVYQYDFEAAKRDDEARAFALRISLGRNHDELVAAIESLTEAMKRDVK